MEGANTDFAWTMLGLTLQSVDVRRGDDGEIEVAIQGRRVGVLAGGDAEEVLPVFMLDPRLDAVGMSSRRVRDDDGIWHLYVNLPEEGFVRRLRDAIGGEGRLAKRWRHARGSAAR
jgi:hypothetical protein